MSLRSRRLLRPFHALTCLALLGMSGVVPRSASSSEVGPTELDRSQRIEDSPANGTSASIARLMSGS